MGISLNKIGTQPQVTTIQPNKNLIIIASYTLLTLILTYPLIFRLFTHIAGFKGEDNLQWRWFLWWFKHSLLTLQNSVINLPLLYAPTGGEQPFYAVATFVPALALPITLLAGPTVSFNLSFLLSFILSGYTAYLLAYYLTHKHLAGFIGGLIFAFYPARFGYATGTFLGQLTVYFLPLYVLALLMLARRPNRRRAIWAALILSCLCLTWPLHVVYGIVIFTIAILLWQIFVCLHQPQHRVTIKYFALTFGLAFVIIIGAYLPLLQSMLQGQSYHLSKDSLKFAIDILAFVSPSNYHPILQPLNLLPDYVTQVLADRDDIQERLAYLGFIPLLLTLLGLIKYRKKLFLWLSIALLTMIFSLGPLLKIAGQLFQINIDGYVGYIILPYALIHTLPILNWSETLGRLNVPTMICLAIMAAYGTSYLLTKIKGKWQFGLVGLLSIFILLEYITIFPFPTEVDIIPDFYHKLRQEGQLTPQKIVDLPLIGHSSYNNYSMHYQTLHQQAIAGGHFIRKPAAAMEMRSFVNQLLSPSIPQKAFDFPDTQERLALLNQFGFTKIVARSWLMTAENSLAQLDYLPTWLGSPSPEGQVSVFEIPPTTATPQQVVSLLDGQNWQSVASILRLQGPADLLIYNEAESQLFTLELIVSAPTADRYLTINLDSRPAIRLYLSPEQLNYQIPINLSPGIHRFTFYPQESCTQNCEAVNFNHISLKPAPINLQPVTFANQLSLLYHDLSSETAMPGQPTLIYLYWQTPVPVNQDYSAFVHLVSADGQLIAQADYLLGGWLYPTSSWQAGFITAVPTLFFVPPDVPPGNYQLLAGIYHTASGERLLLNGEDQTATLVSKIIVGPHN